MSGIPRMDSEGGCRPYLQVFKDAKLLFTSTGRDAQLNKIRLVHATVGTHAYMRVYNISSCDTCHLG